MLSPVLVLLAVPSWHLAHSFLALTHGSFHPLCSVQDERLVQLPSTDPCFLSRVDKGEKGIHAAHGGKDGFLWSGVTQNVHVLHLVQPGNVILLGGGKNPNWVIENFPGMLTAELDQGL